MQLLISDRDGVQRPITDGEFTLEEDRHYTLTVLGGPGEVRAWRDGQPLVSSSGGHQFPLYMGFAVGEVQLRAVVGDEATTCMAQVIPSMKKLDEEAWLALLEDLDSWLGGLSVGAEGPRHGAVGLQGISAPLLVEALLPLVPQVERTFQAVIEQPRLRHIDLRRDVPLRCARQVRPETLSWLSSHPQVSEWLDPWRAAEMVGQACRIVTMGCGVEGVCPTTFVETEDWELEDPEGKPLDKVREIRDEIKARVVKML